MTLYRELNINSKVPYGKYEMSTVGDKLINDRKEIINLIKLGYTFTRDVMEKAGFTMKIRDVKTSVVIVEHEKDNTNYEKDTASLKSILNSLHTIDNPIDIHEQNTDKYAKNVNEKTEDYY